MAIRNVRNKILQKQENAKRAKLGNNVYGLDEKVDPETGEPYYELPGQRKKGVGFEDYQPTLHLNNLDLHNLEKEASKYLPGRTRKAPSKEEMARLLAERKRMQMLREQSYNQESSDLEIAREERNKKIREKIDKKLKGS